MEYALSRSLSPTMIAENKTMLPDKKMFQTKLHESTRYLRRLRTDREKKSPNNFQPRILLIRDTFVSRG